MPQAQLLSICILAAHVACATALSVTTTNASGTISSRTDSSGRYSNRADDTWAIRVNSVLRVNFTAASFESCCDFLYLFHNATSATSYTAKVKVTDSWVGQELRLQGPLLLRFTSDSSVTNTGFRMTYESLQGDSTFTPAVVLPPRRSGQIQSSQIPSLSWRSGTGVMAWVILMKNSSVPAATEKLRLQFYSAASGSANVTLQIFSGAAATLSSSPILEHSGKLCDLARREFSNSGHVTIVLRAATAVQASFVVRYTVSRVYRLTNATGSIASITDPRTSEYFSNADDSWVIDTSGFVRIRFSDLQLETGGDVVRLYERTSEVAAEKLRFQVGTRYAEAETPEFWLPGPVLIRFTTDRSVERRGFNLTYSVTNTSAFTMATQIFTDIGKDIFMGRDSGNYSNNVAMAWVILVNNSQRVSLEFIQFDTESPNDAVKIYKGMETRLSSSPIFEHSGQLSDMPVTGISVNETVTLVFTSDAAGTGRGFYLRTATPRTYFVSNESSIISFSQTNNNSLINYDDSYIIDSNKYVRLKIAGPSKYGGSIEFYETSGGSDQLGFVNSDVDRAANQSEIWLRGPVVVRFKASFRNSNWCNISYNLFDSSNFTTATEVIKSANFVKQTDTLVGAKAYAIPANGSQIVNVNIGFRAARAVTVKFYSGVGSQMSSSPISEQIVNVAGDNPIDFSRRGSVTVVLSSAAAGNRVAATFTLRTTVQTMNFVSAASGSISSITNNRTGKYFNSADDKWVIDSDKMVKISFTKFDLEENYDKVWLYDRTSAVTEGRLVVMMSKTKMSQSEFWLRGPVVVRFTSDGSQIQSGFTLTYAAMSDSNFTMTTEVVGSDSGSRRAVAHPGTPVVRAWAVPASKDEQIRFELQPQMRAVTGMKRLDVKVYSGVGRSLNSSPIFEFSKDQVNNGSQQVVEVVGAATVVFRSSDSNSQLQFDFEVTKSRTRSSPSGSISSINHPQTGKYYDNADDKWVIDRNEMLRISFSLLDVERNVDKVMLYDRTTSIREDRLQLILASSESVGSEFWLQGPVVIRFKSDGSVTGRGFNMSYVAEAAANFTMPTQVIRNDTGSLRSHPLLGSRSYRNDFTFAWVILVKDKQQLKLQFIEFDTEAGNDTVKIFSGMEPRLSRSPIFEHSGQLTDMRSAEITVNATVTVVFTTDSSVTGRGFAIAYSRVFTATVTAAAGGISSDKVQQAVQSSSNIDARWIIDVRGWIQMTFSDLSIEAKSDIIEFHEMTRSATNDSLTFAAVDAAALESEFWLRGPVLIRLATGSSPAARRFSLSYAAANDSKVTMPTEVIRSDGGERGSHADFVTRPYASNLVKAWVIAAPAAQPVIIHFTDFPGADVANDTVSIYSGMEPKLSSSPIFQHTGRMDGIPRNGISANGTVTLVLRTGSSGNARGFSFRFVFPKTYSLTDAAGVISAASAGGSGSRCSHDSWIIDLTGPVRIDVKSLAGSETGTKVQLYEKTRSVRMDRLRFSAADASAVGSEFWLQGPVLIRITSNAFGSHQNVTLTYRALGFTMPTEVIRSDSGVRSCHAGDMAAYGNNVVKAWAIPVAAGKSVLLQFTEFNTQSPSDAVKIYSGMEPKLSSSPLFQHSGNLSEMKTTEQLLNHTVTLVFTTDASGTGRGFKFSFSKQVALSQQSGSIACPSDGSGNYRDNMDKRWLIYRTGIVRLKFHRFSVESGPDYVELFERSLAVSPSKLRSKISSSRQANLEYWLRGPVLVRFRTDGSVTRSGFNLSYSAVESDDMPTEVLEPQRGSEMLAECDIVASDGDATAMVIPVKTGQVAMVNLRQIRGFVRIHLGQKSDSPIFEQSSRSLRIVTLPLIVATENVTIVLTARERLGNRMTVKLQWTVSNITVISDTNSPAASRGQLVNTEKYNWWLFNTSRSVKLNFTLPRPLPPDTELRMYERCSSVSDDKLRFVVSDATGMGSEFTLQGPVMLTFAAGGDSVKDLGIQYWMGDSDVTMATQVNRNITGNCSSDLPPAPGNCSSTAVQAWAIQASQRQTVMLQFPRMNFASSADSVRVFTGMEPYLSSSPILEHSPKVAGSELRNITHPGSLTVVLKSCGSPSSFGFRFTFTVLNVVSEKLTASRGSFSAAVPHSYRPDAGLDRRWMLQVSGLLRLRVTALSGTAQLSVKERASSLQQFTVTGSSGAGSQFLLRGPAQVRFTATAGDAVAVTYEVADEIAVTMATEVVAGLRGSRSIAQQATARRCSSTEPQAWAFPGNSSTTLRLQFGSLSPWDSVRVFQGLQPRMSGAAILEISGRSGGAADSSVSCSGAATVVLRRSGCGVASRPLFRFRRVEMVSETLSGDSGSVSCVADSDSSACRRNVEHEWAIDVSSKVRVTVSSAGSDGPFGELVIRQRLSAGTAGAELFAASGSSRHRSEFWLQGPLAVLFRADAVGSTSGFTLSFAAASDSPFTVPTELIGGGSGERSSHSQLGVSDYASSVTKAWVIAARRDQAVRLTFTEFDTQRPGDLVQVFAATEPHLSSSPLLSHSGTLADMPSRQVAYEGNVTVKFISDASGTGRGFRFNFEVKTFG